MSEPRLERLASVPELAREAGVSRWTMKRRLLCLFATHGGDWMFTLGGGGFAINRSRLKAAHPHVFERRLASREDLEDVKKDVRLLHQRVNAQGARIRRLEGPALEDFTTGANGCNSVHDPRYPYKAGEQG